MVSFDHPLEIKEGMVFALETFCPASDGMSAARIEEEVIVTDKGCRVITLFPAEELPDGVPHTKQFLIPSVPELSWIKNLLLSVKLPS